MGTRIEIIPGTRYGKLTVMGPAEPYQWKHTRRLMWECKCDCGRTGKYSGTHLRCKHATECITCAYRKRPQSQQSKTPLERLYRLSILGRCKKSGIANELSFEDFEQLVTKLCHYCGSEPERKPYAHSTKYVERKVVANGIDRIDSTQGYSLSNCVTCCKACNTAKALMTVEEFYRWAERVFWKRIGPSLFKDGKMVIFPQGNVDPRIFKRE